MTLPISGLLTLADIQTEFGAPSTAKLDDMVRGGSYVPIGTPAGSGSHQTAPMTPNGGPIQIPTSPPLQISHFYGTSLAGGGGGGTVTIDGATIQAFVSSAPFTGSHAHLTLFSDGTIGGGGSPSAGFHQSGPTTWDSVNGGSTDYSSVYTIVVTSISVLNNGATYDPSSAGTVGFTNFTADCPGNKSIDVTWNCQLRTIASNTLVATFTVGISLDNT